MKNKKDDNIISLILVIISLILMFLVVPILGAFGYTKLACLVFIIVILLLFIWCRFLSWYYKKEEKKKYILYGFDKEETDNFKRYFPKKDKDNLIELVKLISNNKITNYDFINDYIENKNEEVAFDILIEKMKYIMIIDWKEELEVVVDMINNLCRRLDYKVILSISNITERDTQYIKNRRKDRIVSTHHDLNVATSVLRKQGYEIVCLWSDRDSYNISIIPIEKIEEMNKIRSK